MDLKPDGKVNIKDVFKREYETHNGLLVKNVEALPFFYYIYVLLELKDKPNKQSFKCFEIPTMDVDFVFKVKQGHKKSIIRIFSHYRFNQHLLHYDDNKFTIDNISKAKNLKEVIEICENDPHKVGTAVNVWGHVRGINKPKSQKTVTFVKWQQDLLDEINKQINQTEEDTRKVIWYYDTVGGSGKSYFAKTICEMSNDYYRISEIGQTKDFAEQIYNAINKKGWTQKFWRI